MRRAMERSQDRISELPDPVLGHILSLMPAKAATRTSILSRRWRGVWEHIWTFATTLDFTAVFATGQTPDEFVGTVNRYLKLHRGKKIERFLVSFDSDRRFFSDVEKWVEFVAAKGVEELRLDFSFERPEPYDLSDLKNWVSGLGLPHQLFDCLSLRILGLRNCGLPPAPNFGRLRSLRSLSLRHVDITDDMLQSILSGCRLLESLLLWDCVCFNSIKMTSPDIRLKQLALVHCWYLFDMEISAPSLQSFHFSGNINFDHSFGDISALVDAFICSIDGVSWEPDQIIKLLSDLAHVEILTVCTSILFAVSTQSEYMPEDVPVPLPNLRELQLLMDRMNLEYLSYIYGYFRLCPSPLLERLFVTFLGIPEDSDEMETVIEQPPDIHFNQLKVIKMQNFKGSRSEMELVRFLLEKAPVLESLILVAPPKSVPGDEIVRQDDWSPGLKFIEEMDMRILQGQLLALPRVSPAVQIVVCEYLEDDTNISPTHTELYANTYEPH